MTQLSKVIDELKRLYKVNPAARTLLDHFSARERNARVSPVERVSSVTHVSKPEIIEVFREFQKFEFGEFKVGRRGSVSRFEWAVAMVSVGKAAKGEATEIQTNDIDDADDEPSATSSESLKHSFRLRTDYLVNIELPANLTLAEANRLADFIKTLPFAA